MMRQAAALVILLLAPGGVPAPAGAETEPAPANAPAADLLRQADEAFDREDYVRARDLYAEIVRLRPGSVHALQRLAFLQAWAGDLEEAESSLRRALSHAPEDPGLLLDLAVVLSDGGDLDAAIRIFRGLRDGHPDDPRILLGLAHALGEKGRYDEAEAVYVMMQDRRIAPIEAHVGRAMLRTLQGEYDDASRFYHDILRASPGNLEARIGMVRIRHRQGLHRSAREQIDNIVLDHPMSREARELQREVHTFLRPRGNAGGFRFSDENGNRVDVASIAATFHAEPQTEVRIALTRHAAEFRCEDRAFCDEVAPLSGSFSEVAEDEAATLIASLTSLVIRSITFHARVGAAWEEDLGGDTRTFGIGGGFIRWEVGPRLALKGSMAREALLDTAVLIDRGIRVDEADAAIEYRPATSWTLLGTAGLASYSDSNARRSAGVSLIWAMRSENPGVSAVFESRYLSFNADRDNGYFDPLRYDAELLTVAVWDDYLERRIFWRIEGTFGRQDFETGGAGRIEAETDDTVQAIHARFGLALGARATLEAFYSKSDAALERATGFTASRSGFDLRFRF